MSARILYLLTSLLCITVLFAACIYIAKTPKIARTHEEMAELHAPCKAHLYDGSLVLFRNGCSLTDSLFVGQGVHWNFERTQSDSIASIPVDSVAFLEYFAHPLEVGPFLAGILGPAYFEIAISDPAIYKAIFGSCPTIYTRSGDHWTCEAECFSYSIAPWFEGSDLDRLDHGSMESGTYSIKLRNEALETHYVNSLALVSVDHAPDVEALPNPDKKPILFGNPVPLLSATDRQGRDILSQISLRDDNFWESDTSQIRSLDSSITRDWIEIQFDTPADARNMVLGVKLRNTLMNTVYFYDVALRSQGIHALDWMNWGIPDLARAWPLKDRYADLFGLHIEEYDGTDFKAVLSTCDAGPICWRLMGAELPVPKPGPSRLRLSSLPGNWAIDWIGLSFNTPQQMAIQSYQPVSIQSMTGLPGDSLAALLSQHDDRYLITYPRDAYQVDFQPSPVPPSVTRDYFIASSGFYIEWIRHEWFAGGSPANIAVSDRDIQRAASLYLEKKENLERQFFGSRLTEAGRTRP